MTKSLILLLSLTGASAFAADAGAQSSANSAAVVNGKATITIDVNGKKETREVDLGNGTEIKVQSGAAAGASASAVAGKNAAPAPVQTWLGVATDQVSEELHAQLPIPDGTGLLIQTVVADSPAAKAGLQKNDVLAKFDDQILTNADQLRALVHTKKAGDPVRLTYLRRGQETTALVTLGSRNGGDEAAPGKLFGLAWDGRNLNFDWKKPGAPLSITSRAVIVDKDGKVVAASNDNPMGETLKELEKRLHEAGVSAETVDQIKKSLANSLGSLQKAAGNLEATQKDASQQAGQKAPPAPAPR